MNIPIKLTTPEYMNLMRSIKRLC